MYFVNSAGRLVSGPVKAEQASTPIAVQEAREFNTKVRHRRHELCLLPENTTPKKTKERKMRILEETRQLACDMSKLFAFAVVVGTIFFFLFFYPLQALACVLLRISALLMRAQCDRRHTVSTSVTCHDVIHLFLLSKRRQWLMAHNDVSTTDGRRMLFP